MQQASIQVSVPDWVSEFMLGHDAPIPELERRAGLVVELSRLNVERGSGGPFGAAVFDGSDGRLLAVGMNLVVAANCSAAHAEIVALAAAQQAVGSYDLGAEGRVCELVSSTEPCAMCLGAVPWSGVRRLVCCAREEDAARAGFDEGDKPSGWPGLFEARGIEVVRDVCRDKAAAVLMEYARSGGVIYNPGRGE